MAIPAALLLPNAIRTIVQTGQAITTAVKSYGAPAALATGTGLALKHLNQNVPSASNTTSANRTLEIIASPHNPATDLPPARGAKLNIQAPPQNLQADHVSHFWSKKSEGPNQNPGNSPDGSPSGGGGGPDWTKVGTGVAVGSLGADYLSRIVSGDGVLTNVANLSLFSGGIFPGHVDEIFPDYVVSGNNNVAPLRIDNGELGVVSRLSLLSADANVSPGGELRIEEHGYVNGTLYVAHGSETEEKGRATIHGGINGKWTTPHSRYYGPGTPFQDAIENSGNVEIGPTAKVVGKVSNMAGADLSVNGLIQGQVENRSGAHMTIKGTVNGTIDNYGTLVVYGTVKKPLGILGKDGSATFMPGSTYMYQTFDKETVIQEPPYRRVNAD